MATRINYDGEGEWADISDSLRNRVVNYAMTEGTDFKTALVSVLGNGDAIAEVEQ